MARQTLDTRDSAPHGAAASGTNAAPSAATHRTLNESVLRFDPAHDTTSERTRFRALARLVDRAARDFAASLSKMVRTTVAAEVTRVERSIHGRLTDGLTAPHCPHVIASPQLGPCALIFDADILYPIIDRLLGGGSEPTVVLRRPFTDIERRLAARITQHFADALRQIASEFAAWELVVRSDEDAAATSAASRHVAVAMFDVNLTVAQVSAPLRLAIPLAALDSWDRPLARWLVDEESPSTAAGQPRASTARELVVELARLRLSTDEIRDLRVGDIITTDQDAQAPLAVYVDGQPAFQALPGAHAGHRAARIV